MPLSDSYGRLPLDSIIVHREARQRQEIETSDLEPSISRRGVLNPIIIDRNFVLIAGERRLEASRRLGLPDIPYRFADQLTPREREIIELEENIKRKDLSWQEIVQATQRIHQIFVETEEGWTQEKTAEELSLTQGTVSMYLKVGRSMEEEKIAGAATVREAHNFLDRREQRVNAEAMEELFGAPAPALAPANAIQVVKPAADSILNEDFVKWSQNYSGSRFNLLHCDFPYGIDAFVGPQMHGEVVRYDKPSRSEGHEARYADSKEIFETLLTSLFASMDRIAASSAHLMFWYTADNQLLADLVRRFGREAPSWNFYKFPLIWMKSDNSGVGHDPSHFPRHTYEACLLAVRGDRKVIQMVGDTYSAPTDTKLHPSAKPEPVLRHFFRMLVDPTTRLLDPTCGSGAALRAAESLGAKEVLGLELNLQTADNARAALREARLKRMAEVALKKLPAPVAPPV